MKVKRILDTVLEIYHDPTFDRIPKETYLRYITDALNAVLLIRPDAHVVDVDFVLADAIEQVLPEDGFRLIDIAYNLDDNGVPTSPIVNVERTLLDNTSPNWMASSGSVVYNYMYNVKRPKSFLVYPKVSGGKKVKMYYSQAFPLIVSENEILNIDEVFLAPIVEIVMYNIYRLDVESSEQSLNKAQFHITNANNMLTGELTQGANIAPRGGD